mmetsp:Transcript_8880/g.12900  ORF Transcript_8880/g.12900 Transcript_8880/m.12900 type:complete len:138 (-) Transcript_8880:61-474(-)
MLKFLALLVPRVPIAHQARAARIDVVCACCILLGVVAPEQVVSFQEHPFCLAQCNTHGIPASPLVPWISIPSGPFQNFQVSTPSGYSSTNKFIPGTTILSGPVQNFKCQFFTASLHLQVHSFQGGHPFSRAHCNTSE